MKPADKIVIDSFDTERHRKINTEDPSKKKIRRNSYGALILMVLIVVSIFTYRYSSYSKIFNMNPKGILAKQDDSIHIYFRKTDRDINTKYDFSWFSGVCRTDFNLEKYVHNNEVAVMVQKERGKIKLLLQEREHPENVKIKYLDIGFNSVKLNPHLKYNLFIIGSKFSGDLTFKKDPF